MRSAKTRSGTLALTTATLVLAATVAAPPALAIDQVGCYPDNGFARIETFSGKEFCFANAGEISGNIVDQINAQQGNGWSGMTSLTPGNNVVQVEWGESNATIHSLKIFANSPPQYFFNVALARFCIMNVFKQQDCWYYHEG